MASRLSLQTLLEDLLKSRNVYFQPPSSVSLKYPAIVYSLSDINNGFADNKPYYQSIYYKVTVIDYDPDSEIVGQVSNLPSCRFDQHFSANNLNHYVFTLYY